MIRRPTVSTRTDTLFSCTTLFRSHRRHRVRGDRRVLLPARDEGDVLRRAGRRADPGASGAPAAGRVLDQRDLAAGPGLRLEPAHRSEEHTSELQSLMRISYAVFCLKKKNNS